MTAGISLGGSQAISAEGPVSEAVLQSLTKIKLQFPIWRFVFGLSGPIDADSRNPNYHQRCQRREHRLLYSLQWLTNRALFRNRFVRD